MIQRENRLFGGFLVLEECEGGYERAGGLWACNRPSAAKYAAILLDTVELRDLDAPNHTKC
jgi:hypothetical protein